MNEQLKTLINYRLEISSETLVDARLLLSNKRYRSAMNRLYYSCFYAVTALLLTEGLSSKTHKGLKYLFNKHFIKNGCITEEFGIFYLNFSILDKSRIIITLNTQMLMESKTYLNKQCPSSLKSKT